MGSEAVAGINFLNGKADVRRMSPDSHGNAIARACVAEVSKKSFMLNNHHHRHVTDFIS
jgi:hypothetical protein